jgi:hypothetical protein
MQERTLQLRQLTYALPDSVTPSLL